MCFRRKKKPSRNLEKYPSPPISAHVSTGLGRLRQRAAAGGPRARPGEEGARAAAETRSPNPAPGAAPRAAGGLGRGWQPRQRLGSLFPPELLRSSWFPAPRCCSAGTSQEAACSRSRLPAQALQELERVLPAHGLRGAVPGVSVCQTQGRRAGDAQREAGGQMLPLCF